MSIYLTGNSILAAHNGNTLQPPTPSTEIFPFLDGTVSLPYFRALPHPILSHEQLITLLIHHLTKAIEHAGWSPEALQNAPIFLASTAYNISIYEHIYHQQHGENGSLDYIAALLRHHLNNPNIYSIATACTSAAQALIQAAHQLNNHFTHQALIIGFECFNRYMPSHFHAMQLLATQLPYQPLIQSNGLILGEAIAALALSTQPTPNSLKLYGFHTQTDSDSFTNLSPSKLEQLITSILEQSGVSTTDTTCVKTHATGGMSDSDEQQLLNHYFPHARHLTVKSYTGHTLGASAAVESAWYQNAICANILPKERCLHYFAGFGGSMAGWISEPVEFTA